MEYDRSICKGCTCLGLSMDMNCVPHYYDYNCPCIDCLIKVMCSEGCDEHEKYVDRIERDYKATNRKV